MVLDASVVVKLFVDEPLSEAAKTIVERYPLLFAPDLIRIEVSSAITRKARNRAIPADMAYEKLREWKRFLDENNLQLIAAEELLEDAEKLSIELRHPLKDCLYLATAKLHRLPLVTADKPFIDALKGRFPKVRHLSEFG